ncbi:MAG: glycosyltransferase family 2 protein [Clostridioides sp.]|jgi:glycosyltransferase involved in cell wall biosynthesis|nr:glycosyltransferase family 2 protein [Clostridioides sp.]
MKEYKITIFTPTYNRGYLLRNLYESIKNNKKLQNECKKSLLFKEKTSDSSNSNAKMDSLNDKQIDYLSEFEWLIVDDGSTDNTKELVEEFIKENEINIRYIYKENGGKHTAINVGVKEAKGELFFIVDSDDLILQGAINFIVEYWNSIKKGEKLISRDSKCAAVDCINNKKVIDRVKLDSNSDKFGYNGIVGACVNSKGERTGTLISEEKGPLPFSDIYYKYNAKGDRAIAWVTDVLKKYPFPEREGIKFLPESVVWHEMSKKYKVFISNVPLTQIEYRNDGLTKNVFKKTLLKGRAFEYLNLLNNGTYPLDRYPYMWIKNYINLARYSLLSESSFFCEIDGLFKKFLYILMFPFGYFKYTKQKDQVKD